MLRGGQGASSDIVWPLVLLEMHLPMAGAAKRHAGLPCLQERDHQGQIDPYFHERKWRGPKEKRGANPEPSSRLKILAWAELEFLVEKPIRSFWRLHEYGERRRWVPLQSWSLSFLFLQFERWDDRIRSQLHRDIRKTILTEFAYSSTKHPSRYKDWGRQKQASVVEVEYILNLCRII